MELNAESRETLNRIAEQHGISLILLFGSAVTGKRHPRSDLDIAVLFQKDQRLTSAEYSELAHGLQEIFPDRMIDLGIINHADPLFLKKITENCLLLYGSVRRLQELKLYAFKRHQDHQRYFQMEREYVKKFLKKAGARP